MRVLPSATYLPKVLGVLPRATAEGAAGRGKATRPARRGHGHHCDRAPQYVQFLRRPQVVVKRRWPRPASECKSNVKHRIGHGRRRRRDARHGQAGRVGPIGGRLDRPRGLHGSARGRPRARKKHSPTEPCATIHMIRLSLINMPVDRSSAHPRRRAAGDTSDSERRCAPRTRAVEFASASTS